MKTLQDYLKELDDSWLLVAAAEKVWANALMDEKRKEDLFYGLSDDADWEIQNMSKQAWIDAHAARLDAEIKRNSARNRREDVRVIINALKPALCL